VSGVGDCDDNADGGGLNDEDHDGGGDGNGLMMTIIW